MKTVVLFGGTFDPPHVGHLLMAHLALEQLHADGVWFLPAPAPPHKPTEPPLHYPLRVEMVKALIQDEPRFSLCTIEASMPKPSYTVDTVRACKRSYPELRFMFLIGTDSLAQLPTWHRADELTAEVEFLVATRSGHDYHEALGQVNPVLPHLRTEELEMPLVDVSSTWLRARRAADKPLCGLVPEQVVVLWRQDVV